jgi:hypothetical protein
MTAGNSETNGGGVQSVPERKEVKTEFGEGEGRERRGFTAEPQRTRSFAEAFLTLPIEDCVVTGIFAGRCRKQVGFGEAQGIVVVRLHAARAVFLIPHCCSRMSANFECLHNCTKVRLPPDALKMKSYNRSDVILCN